MPTRYFSDIHGVCPYNIIDSAAIAAKIGCTSTIQNNLPFILYCTRFALSLHGTIILTQLSPVSSGFEVVSLSGFG